MKILIIDDHVLFREGLCHVLNALDEKVCILQAPNYDSALQLSVENSDLDMILLDLYMPGKDGFIILASLVEKYPALPVVVMSGSRQRSDMQRALDIGAAAYIPKYTTRAEMINALSLILAGSTDMP